MKITIITPVYNNVKTIERTIVSVLEQKNNCEVEYIVIDGMSTDGTIEIINKYKDKIDVFISERDKGIADAYNKGIMHATGELIGIVAADDRLVPGVLNKLTQNYDGISDIVVGKSLIDADPQINRLKISKIEYELDYLKYAMFLPHPSMFIKKTAYERLGLYSLEYKCAMDHELVLRYYQNKASFQFVNLYINIFSAYGGISTTQIELGKKEDLTIAVKYGISEDEWYRVRNNEKKVTLKQIFKNLLLKLMPNSLKDVIFVKMGSHILKESVDTIYL